MKPVQLMHWFAVVMVALSVLPDASTQASEAAAPAVAGPADQQVYAPLAPTDNPTPIVSTGITKYTIASPKLFWYASTVQGCPLHGPSLAATYAEDILRIPTYGGLSRALWHNEAVCNSADITSNLISDGSYLYWVSLSQGAVVKLSTEANPGDPVQVVNKTVPNIGELVILGGTLYALTGGTPGSVWTIDPASGAAAQLIANAGNNPSDLQTDGGYLYWIANGGDLEQWDFHYAQLWVVSHSVTGYGPDLYGYGVYYATGKDIHYYSNYDNTFSSFYTGSDPNATIGNIVLDSTNIYFFEQHLVNCVGLFCQRQYDLFRAGKNGSSPAAIFVSAALTYGTDFPGSLNQDGDYLFWQASGQINRLAKNASALPLVNMRVTGLEITQAVQKTDNSVQLIENKRTFVRVYVKSDGAPVAGVTAYLYLTNGTITTAGPLVPVNPVGQTITVQSLPSRDNLNDAFLFELPWNWLNGTIHLRAVLNPNGVPPQASYANNQYDSAAFTFKTSPRLQVQFIAFGYYLNNQVYYPRFVKDIIQTYSWIRRVYPVASTPGFSTDPSAGFRPNLWFVPDDDLGTRVNQTNAACNGLKDKSLCASAYTNSLLNQLRTDNNIASNIFLYGMISDGAGTFPRGQAGSGNVSSGPAGTTCCGSAAWDTDGSYADWYAGHEIGHTLGRNHPWTGSSLDDSVCGQTPSDGALDKSYPYPDSQIGPNDKSLEGFDTGDGELGIAPNIYPGNTWKDNMSYCPNKWISDYTYNGMYSYMIAHPSAASIAASQTAQVTGNFLSVFGTIYPNSSLAQIDILRHTSSVGQVPPITAGDYSIRLVGASGTLADYAFTPADAQNSNEPTLSFAQVVNFVAGTTEVQIVKLAGNQVLATHALSPHAPVISNVALQGAPNPVTGTVTLAWNASDPDNDPLSFDILYSRDGGNTFQPVMVGMKGSSAQVDTARLGGSGSALLRVVATDGSNTAQGDSATFTMANKPPQPVIQLPADGLHVHYGQLVNFSGAAEDFQDGGVTGGSLVWSNQKGVLGNGPLLSSTNLPVGTNRITLTATNSLGLPASASITVYVDDNLNLPGPTLSAGPSPISVQVAAGDKSPQSAHVTIENVGSGSLNWTATSSAAWLKLGATSTLTGTAPATLDLTLDPTGLTNGQSQTTDLVITSPAASDHITETITIPVSLSMGDAWHNSSTAIQLFLPLVDR